MLISKESDVMVHYSENDEVLELLFELLIDIFLEQGETDDEYRILAYFTAVGTARVYHYYQEYGYEEVKKLLDSFDDILRKLGNVDGRIVYRMDTYESHLENEEYLQKYLKYIQDGICLKIPWALSVSMENWNETTPQHPIWAIELLPDNSKAHPVFPFLTEDETLQKIETMLIGCLKICK
jgi:hypothetical protein